ncbi:MAG TPA: A/G-specific adenine glycosylase [Bacteroidetes bacterium]|nr:A/G-specific adenine glycosylase [Bacteroidota bacterium]
MNWYHANSRPLPWRETGDPYLIWLSEIILQQTRVEQGLPYFERFRSSFPTVEKLAEAPESAVMKHWQGLGYYSRARNLHQTAKIVAGQHQGKFPDTYAGLLRLKGIGPYTAAAIASIAFNEAVPVVDGNVYRFISRYLAIDMPVGTPTAQRCFSEILLNYLPQEQAGLFNQALMEFGALQCTPRPPDCETCPFRSDCAAYKLGQIDHFPVKSTKTKVKEVFYHFIVMEKGDKLWLSQRDDSGLWKKLWHFPMLETEDDLNANDVMDQVAISFQLTAAQLIHKGNWKTVHLLSHRKIQARFWQFESEAAPRKKGIFEINRGDLESYALPQLMVKYIRHKEGGI